MRISPFSVLPALIPFASLWHAECYSNKVVNINVNYSHPATLYLRYIFLVLFTVFSFTIRKIF